MSDMQVKLLKCQQCSAALHPRADQPLLRCAFCGSNYLVEGLPAGTGPAPLNWLPFAVDPGRARRALEDWLASGFLRPGDLAAQAQVGELSAVMIPVYLGRARAHSNWSAEVVRKHLRKVKTVIPPGVEVKTGDGVRMRSDSHLLAGAHDGEYQHLVLLASRGVSASDFDRLALFDLQRLEPMPGQVDVAVEEPTLSSGEAMREIRHRIEDAERSACAAMVPGGGTVTDLRVNTVVQDLAVELAYVPLWIASYRYNEKAYRVLVNGQNAQVSGESPLSVPRVVAAAASLLALPAAIAWYLWRRRR